MKVERMYRYFVELVNITSRTSREDCVLKSILLRGTTKQQPNIGNQHRQPSDKAYGRQRLEPTLVMQSQRCHMKEKIYYLSGPILLSVQNGERRRGSGL
jgi:hypothetical protein